MLILNILDFILPEIESFIRTDGHSQFHSAIDSEQEYTYTLFSRNRFPLPLTYCDRNSFGWYVDVPTSVNQFGPNLCLWLISTLTIEQFLN